MSYNVRLFNKWGWIEEDNIKQESINFINNQDLDIICIQEYYNPNNDLELNFKYSHIGIQKRKEDWHMAIYSKYPQINKKTVNIDGARMNNSCIYSDIVVNDDTSIVLSKSRWVVYNLVWINAYSHLCVLLFRKV